MTLTRLLILLACLALLPAVSLAGDATPPAGDIVIKADSMNHNRANDAVNAEGNVVMEWGGMTMTSDHATYNRNTRIMTASGNIVLTKGDDVMQGESLTLNMETGRGELENANINVQKSNASFTGKKIISTEDNTIEIIGGELTTCMLPDPSWKFKADKLQFNIAGYAVGRNVVFYIRDIPLLYVPWIAFPVVLEKRTGFLFPRFGYSNTRGAQVDIPFYWVIAHNQDLLVDLDIQTTRGVGGGAEYRYARKKGSEGFLGGYIIYDLEENRQRGQLAQRHKEIFSDDMNLRSALNLTSDRNFMSDFGEKSGDYNRQSSESTVNALKTWQHYALTANMRYVEDYYAVDNSNTVQTMPRIGLAAVRQQLFTTPLFFDLDSGASNIYRTTGPRGQRFDAFPRLSLVSGLPGYLHASAYAGLHLRGYNTVAIPDGSRVKDIDGDLLPEVGWQVSSSLSRIYDVNLGFLKKLRHELIPELSYRYTPERDQSRLPFYDADDRLIHQNIVYYGITSLLGGKFQNGDTVEYHHISRIKLLQGYSIEGTRRDLLTLSDANRPLSDVILESDLWLHPYAKLTFDARYDVYENRLSSAAPGIEVDDQHGTTAGISYRVSHNKDIPANENEYLEGRISTKMFKPWTFGYTTRYSFDRPGGYLDGFLESVYSVEYRHQCWSLGASLIDRFGGSTSFRVSFNLVGLTGSSPKQTY